MCWRRDVTARSSAPILPVGNLCRPKQQEIARTVKRIVEGGRPEESSQSMQGTHCLLFSTNLQINASEQKCNICLLVKRLNSADSKTHVRCS